MMAATFNSVLILKIKPWIYKDISFVECGQIMRFCQSFMDELYRYLGPDQVIRGIVLMLFIYLLFFLRLAQFQDVRTVRYTSNRTKLLKVL